MFEAVPWIVRRWGPDFFATATADAGIYPLSLHDALPISRRAVVRFARSRCVLVASPPRRTRTNTPATAAARATPRSEEHTSELQSRENLVCRLLLEKKNHVSFDSLRSPLMPSRMCTTTQG